MTRITAQYLLDVRKGDNAEPSTRFDTSKQKNKHKGVFDLEIPVFGKTTLEELERNPKYGLIALYLRTHGYRGALLVEFGSHNELRMVRVLGKEYRAIRHVIYGPIPVKKSLD